MYIRFRAALFISLILLLGLTACAGPAPAQSDGDARLIADGIGREVLVPASVERIVCVGVGALRYTCYMQAQDLVIGVEDYEREPGMTRPYQYVNFGAFRDLPVIGANGEPYAEEIIRLGPDVIVMSAYAAVDPDEIENKTGIPVFVVPGSDGVLDEGAYETIRLMGGLYGKEARAEELTSFLRGIEADLSNRTADIPDEEKPTVYVGGVAYQGYRGFEGTEAGYGPLALIRAVNLADRTGRTGAFNIDTEQILLSDPDVIFLDYNGLDLVRKDYAEHPDFYQALTAVKEGRVYSQISFRSFASNLETALADAYYAACVLYPTRFADIDPEEKAGELFAALLGENPYPEWKEAGYAFRPIEIGGL